MVCYYQYTQVAYVAGVLYRQKEQGFTTQGKPHVQQLVASIIMMRVQGKWKRVVVLKLLLLGMGDSCSFGSVLADVNAQYGDMYEVKREDCIGHVQKRLGTTLHSYTNKQRDAVLSGQRNCKQHMGLLSAITKLIKSLLLQLFGPYIITSVAHQKKVLKASILSAQMVIKLGKYHKDKIFNTKTYYRSQCFPFVFHGELHEMSTRLPSPDACQFGLTQSQNESISNMIWSKYPKRVLCIKSRFVISVCESNGMREHMEESNFSNH